jgi:hypothetical protein
MQSTHGKVVKLCNSPSHQWSTTEDVLVHLLQFFSILSQCFLESNHPFGIHGDR